MIDTNRRVLPGFSLSLGYTLFYVGVLVLVPVAAGALRASALTAAELWAAVSPRGRLRPTRSRSARRSPPR